MSHYDTLGLPPDASPAQIKSAFRRMAMQHHPDRGGDTEVMKLVQEAYDVLSDPARRKHYDETGQSRQKKEPTVRERAVMMMPDLFAAVLGRVTDEAVEGTDLLVALDKVLVAEADALQQKVDGLKAIRKRTGKALKRLRAKAGHTESVSPALLHMIETMNSTLKPMEQHLQVLAEARKLLAEHEYEWTPPAPKPAPFVSGRMEMHFDRTAWPHFR